MTKLPLGGKEFTAAEPDYDRWSPSANSHFLGYPHEYFWSALYKIRKIHRVKWFCDTNKTDPQKPPTSFQKIEPHLLVYYDPDPLRPGFNDTKIRIASDRAGRKLMSWLNYTDVNKLNADIIKDYGLYDVPYDISKVIDPISDHWLDIEIELSYVHIELKNPKILPHAAIVLSLPDRVTITARKIKKCTELGLVDIKDDNFWGSVLDTKVIKAETKDAWRARRFKLRQDIARKKAEIEKLRDDVADIQDEIEAGKPKDE